MQYTDKLNLSKPDGSDYVEVQVLSENFQKIDDAIGGFAYSLQQNTTTASRAVSKDEIVFYNNGLYIATDDIAQGESSFTDKLTQITGGVLNYLNNKDITSNITFGSIVDTTTNTKLYSQGKMRVLMLGARLRADTTPISARTNTVIGTLEPSDYPNQAYSAVIYRYTATAQVTSDIRVVVGTTGNLSISCENALSSQNYLRGELIWFVD